MKKNIDNIICIVTCKNDQKYLDGLLNSSFIKNIDKNKNIIIPVFFDNSIDKSFLSKNNELYLKYRESYDTLSVKIHMAIKYFVKKYNFKYLIKIDSTIFDLIGGRKYGWRDRYYNYNFKYFETLFCSGYFFKYDYTGLMLNERVNKKDIESWCKNKKLSFPNFNKVFEIFKKPKNYITGKAYSLSYNSCKVISNEPIDSSIIFEKNIHGIEDIFISTILNKNKIYPEFGTVKDLKLSHNKSILKYFKYKYRNKKNAVILSCGPSISDQKDIRKIIKKLKKTHIIVCVKKSLDLVDECDFLVTNPQRSNDFLDRDNFDFCVSTTWESAEREFIINKNKIFKNSSLIFNVDKYNNNKFVLFKKDLKKFKNELILNTTSITRGPGVVIELAIPLLLSIGVRSIVTYGWDILGYSNGKTHFYGKEKVSKIRNDEIEALKSSIYFLKFIKSTKKTKIKIISKTNPLK